MKTFISSFDYIVHLLQLYLTSNNCNFNTVQTCRRLITILTSQFRNESETHLSHLLNILRQLDNCCLSSPFRPLAIAISVIRQTSCFCLLSLAECYSFDRHVLFVSMLKISYQLQFEKTAFKTFSSVCQFRLDAYACRKSSGTNPFLKCIHKAKTFEYDTLVLCILVEAGKGAVGNF